jgi:putative ABC transport system permease protein
MNDVRHAARSLLRAPGFTVVSVATLALAIGACTAIYSIVHGVLLRPLPYPEPDRIVQVWQQNARGGQTQFSDPNYEDVRDQARLLGPVAQVAYAGTMILAAGEPRRVSYALVSREFFDVFRTQPRVGRVFDEAERHEGAPGVAVISHALWMSGFGRRDDLAALSLRVSGRPYAIVGVMPPHFDFPLGTDVWVPREQSGRSPYRTGHNWQVVARLEEGATLDAARADLSAVAHRLKVELGDDTQMFDAMLVPLDEQLTGPVSRRLVVLLAAVGSLVLIACANLINLLLVRVASRGRELAVRAALGARRASLAAPFVSEAVLLAAAGGALGILVARGLLGALLALNPGNLPRMAEIGLSLPVMVFAIGVTAATAVLLALAAAWRALRPGIADTLRSASRGQAGGAAVSRVRGALIVAQLACSIVLLIGAGLLARSMTALLAEDPGFATERVLAIDYSLPAGAGDSDARAAMSSFHSRYLDALAAVPGVEHAGGISGFPLASRYSNGTFLKVRGDETWTDLASLGPLFRDPSRTGDAEFRVASAGYFRAMDIPLTRGRLFEPGDVATAPHVAVISESLAQRAWPGEDPLGRRIQFGGMDGDLTVFTIVGIVGDIRERGLHAAPRPTVYADFRQRPRMTGSFTAVVRGPVDALSLAPSARTALRELNPEIAPRIRGIEEIFAASVADRRFTLIVVGTFAAFALLLAVLGIYGVLSYVVSQRTREFGVRLALGAQRGDVWRLVLGQASVLVAIGSALGLIAAYFLTRLMESLLYEVKPLDPATFAGVVVILAAAAFLASQLPALRATRVDPMEALRAE